MRSGRDAALRARLVTSHSGGSGPRSGATKGALRGARWTGWRQCQFPETRPGADGGTPSWAGRLQMPRWSAERRGLRAQRARRRKAWRPTGASRRSIPSAFRGRAYRSQNSDATSPRERGSCLQRKELAMFPECRDEDTRWVLNNALKFWTACPTKRCRRARSCVGDTMRCHDDLLAGGAAGAEGLVARRARCQARSTVPRGRPAAWPRPPRRNGASAKR